MSNRCHRINVFNVIHLPLTSSRFKENQPQKIKTTAQLQKDNNNKIKINGNSLNLSVEMQQAERGKGLLIKNVQLN